MNVEIVLTKKLGVRSWSEGRRENIGYKSKKNITELTDDISSTAV